MADQNFDSTDDDVQIGFLRAKDHGGFAVVCMKCEEDDRKHGAAPLSCKLYKVNVRPYKQTCHSCKRVLHEGSTELYPSKETVKRALFGAPVIRQSTIDELRELHTPSAIQPNPDVNGFYKWTLEIEVHKTWVEDGFDLTDKRAHAMLAKDLDFARSNEIKARVLTRPNDEAMAKKQGYGDVERYRKERNK